MGAFDRRIELQLALRNVTGGALVITDLRACSVSGAGGEIHIVVTRSAGDPSGPGEISIRLRCTRILLMAHLATTRVGRINNSRIIMKALLITDDLIRLTT